MAHILIVEDETIIRSALRRLLERNQYQVSEAGSVQEAQERYTIPSFDMVVSDLRLPGAPGTELIKLAEGIPVLIMTSYASLRSAVDSMKMGAVDYIAKPFDHDEMLQAVARILKDRQENRSAAPVSANGGKAGGERGASPAAADGEIGIIGSCAPMQELYSKIRKVAPTDSTVLIQGESGTGKEVVARNLHYHSKRREGPFVPVNCGAIPAELLESELFGHEKGAFTGAITSRAGRFELANGGTLFLDEIGDMPLPMQVKLLRVLQERTFERVGSNKTQNVDVRIIAATHKNLEKMIEDGTFREDLYYRLNVFPIEMAPLRERVEDIALLLNELISRMEHEKRGSIRFNSAAIMSLCRHDWPGNVRELANLVERLAIMHPYGVIGVGELPKKFRHVDDEDEQLASSLREELEERAAINAGLPGMDAPAMLPAEGLDLKDYLANLEQGLIQQALDDAGGVVARAAERLRIRRTTLVEKMRKYGMSRRDDDLSDD